VEHKRVPKPKKHQRKAVRVSDTYIRRGILWLMGFLGILSFGILGARLVKVMVIDHEYYQEKAITNIL
jgi:hypothetical protein